MNLNISEIVPDGLHRVQVPPVPSLSSMKKPVVANKPVEKKKVTYDDILSSLQMKVIDGKLQFARTDVAEIEQLNQQPQPRSQNQTQKKTVSFSQGQMHTQPVNPMQRAPQKINMAPKTAKTRHLPVPQEYAEEVQPQVPMTKRESLIQLLMAQQEAARVREVKSTKLMFSTNNVSIAPTVAPHMSNMFFKFR
jgi:hypothetical protein